MLPLPCLPSQDVTPLYPSNPVQRMGDLSPGAAFRGVNQVGQDIVSIERRFVEAAQRGHGIIAVSLLVIRQPLNAELFFFFGGPGELGAV